MHSVENKHLLIWPPFLASNVLPLGVPCLAAYLRHNGVRNIQVLDLNFAYLGKMGFSWLLYKILRRGSSGLKQMASPLYGYVHNKIYEVLASMELAGKKNIPWSLNSILGSFRDSRYKEERSRVLSLLRPVMAAGDFSSVCISANYPEQLFFALMIAQEVKESSGGRIKTVLGGAQVTKHIGLLMKAKEVWDLVDFLVTGDGEKPLFELLKGPGDEGLGNIPNLYYKDAARSGEYLRSASAFHLSPDDFSVPDFSDFDLETYDEVFPLIISKGCPWAQCTFCSYSGVHERKFFLGKPEKAVEMITGSQKMYGAEEFCFMDDALPAKFMRALAQELVKSGVSVKWSTSILISREFTDRELCRSLKTSGFDTAFTGLETISGRLLGLMKKYHQGLGESDVREIFKVLKSEGIRVVINIIFGFPTETLQEARQTVDFLARNIELFDSVRMQPFCLEDQTCISREPERFGISRIRREDKNVGRRLGFYFEVKEGMSQEEAVRFTYTEAGRSLARARTKKAS